MLATEEFEEVWEELSTISNLNVDTKYGGIHFSFDWKNHVEEIKNYNLLSNIYTLENYYNKLFTEEEVPQELFNPKIIELKCNITTQHDHFPHHDSDMEERIVIYHLENVLVKVFLAMNISTPGSFNPLSQKLSRFAYDIYYYTPDYLECARSKTIKFQWFTIERLKLSEVWHWLDSNLESRQLAENRTERALYSILHISREGSITPASILWTALALEALYKTPKFNAKNVMIRRIFSVLDISEDMKEPLNEKINEFYSLRSQLIHGELEINNPLSNNVLDNRIFDYQALIMDTVEFGLAIVLATLHKMIKENVKILEF